MIQAAASGLRRWGSSRHGVVLDVQNRSPRGARQPKGCALLLLTTLSGFLEAHFLLQDPCRRRSRAISRARDDTGLHTKGFTHPFRLPSSSPRPAGPSMVDSWTPGTVLRPSPFLPLPSPFFLGWSFCLWLYSHLSPFQQPFFEFRKRQGKDFLSFPLPCLGWADAADQNLRLLRPCSVLSPLPSSPSWPLPPGSCRARTDTCPRAYRTRGLAY